MRTILIAVACMFFYSNVQAQTESMAELIKKLNTLFPQLSNDYLEVKFLTPNLVSFDFKLSDKAMTYYLDLNDVCGTGVTSERIEYKPASIIYTKKSVATNAKKVKKNLFVPKMSDELISVLKKLGKINCPEGGYY